MALNTAGVNAIMDDGNEAVIYAAVGNGSLSSSETSVSRILLTLGTPVAGVISVTNVPLNFLGTPGAGATNVLLFSASAAGTFYGFQPLIGDAVFNAAGNYQITGLTMTGVGT